MKKLLALSTALVALLASTPAAGMQSWGSNDRIVFSSNRAEDGLHTMSATGSNQVKLTDGVDAFEEQSAWSPDSQRILFVNYEGGDAEIWIVRANGNGRKNLTDNTANDTGPAWEPDGKSFLFTSDRNGASDLYRYRLRTGNVRRLTVFGGVSGLAASPSPDGERIAFSKQASGFNEIYTMTSTGTGVENLTETPDVHEQVPSWSPDGKHIAVVRNSAIATVRVSSGNSREVVPSGFGPSWSPNGAFLTYQAFDGTDTEIFRIRPDGTAERNLTKNSLFDFFID